MTSYMSVNYSSFAFWTDGKRDGSLMPNDSGLRKCQCGNYFLQSEAVKLEIPAGDDREFTPHVHTSDLKHAIATAKRKADSREHDSMMDSTTENTENSSGMKKAKMITCGSDLAPRRSIENTEGNYWDSPEAKKLFLGTTTDERSVQEVLKQRIERLQGVNRSPHGWKDLIERHDVDNLCSPHDVFIIRQRCQILCLAYMFALEEMNSAKWVDDCCAQAIFVSNGMGVEAATSKRTVAGWNILLRANQEHFPQPDPTIHKDKKPLPDLLEYF